MITARTTNAEFFLAVDLTYGVVYCFHCGDYVHDEVLEKILREERAKAWRCYGMYGSVTCEFSAQIGSLLSGVCSVL